MDDDPDLCQALKLRLRANHYDTVHAVDGYSAIAQAYKERPNLIILDLGLPAGDGFVVLDRLQRDDKLSTIPVVVLTSSHEEKDKMRSYDFGVNAYVVKPVNFHEFVNAVRELGVFWAVINEPPPGSVKKST